MAALTVKRIERLIYPVSFYRHKARHVKATCRILVDRFGGRVPGTMEELLTLPGVGRKTANLVLILAFKSARNICVDTHVHRISNRLGWVRTKTPDETEQALYAATAPRWWPSINLYLVTWGQNVCRPVYPRCGACVIGEFCPRIGVARGGAIVKGLRAAVLAALLVPCAPCPREPGGRRRTAVRSSSSRRPTGVFAFETFPDEAPRTVAHILELVKSGFYDGQRFHRAIPGFVVQWGDPQSRTPRESG